MGRARCAADGEGVLLRPKTSLFLPQFLSSPRTVRRVAADAQEHEQGKQKRQRLPVSGQRTKKNDAPQKGNIVFCRGFPNERKAGEVTKGRARHLRLPRDHHPKWG